MGLMDTFRARLSPAKDKVADLAQQHGGKIGDGLDKAARTVDQRTKGKYSDKIDSGAGKAKSALDRLAHMDDGGTASGGTTPGSGTPGGTPPGGTPPPPA